MKVKFLPQDVEHEIKPGQSVMDLAHEKGLPIRSTCNGLPSCAECRVKVVDGDWNVSPPSKKELSLIGTGFYIDQRRLSCQMLCFGDITVDLQEQVEKASEGPVTKKFLTKVHKSSAEESHSVGGVLIEQDEALLAEIKKDVKDVVEEPARNSPQSGSDRPQANRQMRDHRPNQQNQNQRQGQNQGGNRHRRRRRGGGGGGRGAERR